MLQEIEIQIEPAINYGQLDVIGKLLDQDSEGNPVVIQGWHVNSPWVVSDFEDKKVQPITPRRVFAGGSTFCYSFESEQEFLSRLSTADLSAPLQAPSSVTRRQARQALLLAGLLNKVQPAIDAIPDATQRAMVQIEWDDSQVFERNRQVLISLGAALGMTSDDLDDLFIQASKL